LGYNETKTNTIVIPHLMRNPEFSKNNHPPFLECTAPKSWE